VTTGKVYLIGAGLGDPELLTLKAVRALGEADVVLVDDLVDRDILCLAPRARVIEVGKRGGCKSTPQQFIERLIVRYARQGRFVARLKGDDPFVFGRGGEESPDTPAAAVENGTSPEEKTRDHRACTAPGVRRARRNRESGAAGDRQSRMSRAGGGSEIRSPGRCVK